MLRLLERRGWRKAAWQTPLEFAASLPQGDVSAPVARLTDLYLIARFGNRESESAGKAAATGADTGTDTGAHRGKISNSGTPADAQTFATLLAAVQTSLRIRRASRQ